MNMALDEALLDSATAEPNANATLRIYQWAEPTLSLGYFQQCSEREDHEASRDCDLIRRPSGGGAILHHHELTYSLVLPKAIAQGKAASGWYDKVHKALIDAIYELTGASACLCENPPKLSASEEPFLCFERRASGDVLLDEHKIAGSAQRRRRDAILQHGSVLLKCSAHAPELPGISDLANAELRFADLAELLGKNVARRLGFDLQIGEATSHELHLADELARDRYNSDAWTLRR